MNYVRTAKLRGALFEDKPSDYGTIYTSFWVDHEEPLDALEIIRSKGVDWSLGDLPDGHESLIIVSNTVE